MSVYNGEKYLRKAVESILNQTYTDFEFILIDDGSQDCSRQIMDSYHDPRIVRLNNPQNMGLVYSLNVGLRVAQGVYIARQDADDTSLPERLAKQVSFLDTHPEIGVLGTGVQIVDSFGNASNTVQSPTEPEVLRWRMCFFNPFVHSTVMMRRQIVKQVGGYSSDMVHAEDYDLWRRLSYVTRLSNLQDVLLQFRKHDASISNRHVSEQRQNGIQICRLMISHVLNEEVPAGIVNHLWCQEFQTVYEVRQAAKLIYRVYKAIVSNGKPTAIEKQAIRRDAAMRLIDLSQPWVQDVSIWGVLAQAYFLDPLLMLRGVKDLKLRLKTLFSTKISR
jgi:glycosyltransferase involved in cell wall biosynthesis